MMPEQTAADRIHHLNRQRASLLDLRAWRLELADKQRDLLRRIEKKLEQDYRNLEAIQAELLALGEPARPAGGQPSEEALP